MIIPSVFDYISILFLNPEQKIMNNLTQSTNIQKINTVQKNNDFMNKSAILIDRLQLQLAQQLPRYVAGVRRASKLKTININKGLYSLGVKNKTIHNIIEASIKQALKQQKSVQKISQNLYKNKANYKNKKVVKPYPRRLLNILYRQNIKNYNPYVVALGQIEESKSISPQQKDRIKKLCYIGITRNYLQMKKYFSLPKYSRVGILIRTYMVDVMRGNLEKKMETQPHSIYIPINQTALSFNPYERPKQIQEYISKKKFTEVIKSVNKIIEIEYEKYKRGNFQFIKSNFTYSEIMMYLIIIFIIICTAIWVPEPGSSLQYAGFVAVLAASLSGMGFAWLQCKNNLKKVCAPNNITGKILQRLRQYLKSISDETLTWKVGPDFYWIQIENVKVKKKKKNENTEVF